VQLAPDVLGLIHEPDSLTFFKKPQVAGGRYLALAFARRAGCDAQEPRQVCVGITAATLGDVRRNRHRCSSELLREPEAFIRWERCRRGVHILDEPSVLIATPAVDGSHP
jgi:hypothetical protein